MEANEILKKAWEAVQASGVPESMQDTAFKEAVAILRGDSGEGGSTTGGGPAASTPQIKRTSTGPKKAGPKSQKRKTDGAPPPPVHVPDEANFFSELASESGVSETDLRDILQLYPDGTVNVTPPTRTLGGNKAEQARTVLPLVVGARLIGLKESPVSAAAVRNELNRKNCYDQGNFGAAVLGRLAGFNYGGSNAEIVATSKWVDDFAAAVRRAHGRDKADKEKKE
jgi:hypothetical protein